MKTSPRGLAELASHEGIVLSPYKDSVGVWTIGIGHTKAAGPPDPATSGPISLAEAMALFRRDVAKYEAEVDAVLHVPVAQHEFDALVSFHYNTGAIRKASLIDSLNAGDRKGAAERMMLWVKPVEIIPRRKRERDLFLNGTYGNGWANVYAVSAGGAVQWSQVTKVNAFAALAAAPNPPIDQPVNLRIGDKGDRVKVLQSNLSRLGYALVIDGDFGPATDRAVKAFQTAHKLTADGIVGPKTAAAIVEAMANKEA